jgi:tryptophanyl-tRNA synthetase
MEQGIVVEINTIIQFALTIIAALFIWYIKTQAQKSKETHDKEMKTIHDALEKKAQADKVAEIEERLKNGDKRMTEIECNYIKRFEEVTASIHNTREAILQGIGDLKETMLTNFVTKEDCRAAQAQNKH